MPDYWTGLIEGFQGRREGAYKENFEREVQNRQLSDRVFQHLLASRDPQLQSLALSGMMNPITRKKGFQGWLGQVSSSNPIMEQIVARMNEEVPIESSAPTPSGGPPPPPGAAAMSLNAPVEPGSAPIGMGSPESELSAGMEAEAGPMGPPPMGPPPTPDMATPGMMGPPPESKWKRRGTMVPTAEEVAEATTRAQLQAKIATATTFLQQAGATPDEIQQMIMGMMGAPQNNRNLSTVTQWGVKLPGSDLVQPVLLDQQKGYVLPGGQVMPPGSQMVRMSGTGAGGALTSTVADSPEARQQLAELGADPAILAGGTATGYWRVRQGPMGVMIQPGEYTPPPAYAGTIESTDPQNPRVPVRRPVLRGGGVGDPLADVDQPVKSKTQVDAEGLLSAVDEEVKLLMGSSLGRLRGIEPARRNQIVLEKARVANLPYRTYDELLAAVKATPPVSTRERETGGTIAEQVRQQILRDRESGTGSTPPPGRPSARSQGAGPRR